MKTGENCIISNNTSIGENLVLGHNVIIEDNVEIGNNVFIDSNTIVRNGSRIGDKSIIASNCILGEYQSDYFTDFQTHNHMLYIGSNAIIRSGSIVYSGSTIGDNFQTGHRVTIREQSEIGKNCSIGTLSDIQGHCKIGDFVRMHSNVHIGMSSVIEDFVWVYPYVVLTNDPTPPSETEVGVHVHSFAVIATSSTILPGVDIASDSLVAAGATVSKNVNMFEVVGGTPAKVIADIRSIKNRETGEAYYPWRNNFKRYMPWKDKDFPTWIETLSEEDKIKYGVYC